MARWPAPGRCKARLASDLLGRLNLAGVEARSAWIQQRLTGHTLAVAAELQRQALFTTVLAVSGLGPVAAQRWGQRHGIAQVRLQGPGSLGTRMKRQLLIQRSAKQAALVIGSDLPDLNRQDLLLAAERLAERDLVLGPASDGGYWLIGLSARLLDAPERWPLSGIPWGGPQVCQSTLKAAWRAGLSTDLLAERQDVDHLSDLDPWLG